VTVIKNLMLLLISTNIVLLLSLVTFFVRILRTREHPRADYFSHLHCRRTAGEHPLPDIVLSPFWLSPSAKSRLGSAEGCERVSACAIDGRLHVAYVYFLQLTLRDSTKATRLSLTTAMFTAATRENEHFTRMSLQMRLIDLRE